MTKQEFYKNHQYSSNCPYCGKEFHSSLLNEEIDRNYELKCHHCGGLMHISKEDKKCIKFEDFLKSLFEK